MIGFWVVAMDFVVSFGGGVNIDVVNDIIGYALMLVGVGRIGSVAAAMDGVQRNGLRFPLVRVLLWVGLAFPAANHLRAVSESELFRAFWWLTSVATGRLLLSSLSTTCHSVWALWATWRRSAGLWLWCLGPLTALFVFPSESRTINAGSLGCFVGLLATALLLTPVIHAHISAFRTLKWDRGALSRCPRCRYPLADVVGERCPECGLEFERMGGRPRS